MATVRSTGGGRTPGLSNPVTSTIVPATAATTQAAMPAAPQGFIDQRVPAVAPAHMIQGSPCPSPGG
jgi:hypothetical protein